MITRDMLAARLDLLMEEESARFLHEVPFASHLTDAEALDVDYYLRHRIETIKRIRLTARTDAVALALMIEEDYDAARPWGRYVSEELCHDTMFLDDLAKHGVAQAAVEATPLFASTKTMMDYLDENIGRVGSIAAVAYSIFVEWNSARYSSAAVRKAAVAFGDGHVEGSRSHAAIDEDEDHYEVMVDIAHRLLQRGVSEEVLSRLVRDFAALFRRYFEELYRSTRKHHAAA